MYVDLNSQPYSSETSISSTALEQAENLIRQKGGRFTLIRKHIYQLLLSAKYPMGAYDIISQLNGVGSQKPPTVYRALAWLIDYGLAAKIAYNSRYTAIPLGVEADDLAFVICRNCGETNTLEAPGLSKSLLQTANDKGFSETKMFMEIIGLCSNRKKGCTE